MAFSTAFSPIVRSVKPTLKNVLAPKIISDMAPMLEKVAGLDLGFFFGIPYSQGVLLRLPREAAAEISRPFLCFEERTLCRRQPKSLFRNSPA
jgi:hypothetical protein